MIIVVECVPSAVAKAITEAVTIPVIGIGAGPHTSGQVLVYHDLLGLQHHPHHEKHVPSFCKKYAQIGTDIHRALVSYKEEVHSAAFPTEEHNPYKMSAEEQGKFRDLLAEGADKRAVEAGTMQKKIREADEYEVVKLY